MKQLPLLLGTALFFLPAAAQVKQPPANKQMEVQVVTQVQQVIGTIALNGFNLRMGNCPWPAGPVKVPHLIINRPMDIMW